MIKKFEDFVLECYGNPVNEAFQSSKLREIIKQHGKPKSKYDIKYLYDIKDDNIVDVVDNSDEYYDKYIKGNGYGEENPYSSIPLEDGSVIVMKSEFRNNAFNKMSTRHNHKMVNNNIDKLEVKRFASNLKKYIPEIIEAIDSKMNNISEDDFDEDKLNFNFKINLGGIEYDIFVDCIVETPNNGFTIEWYAMDYFEIYNEDGYADSYALGITEDTYEDVFKAYYI